MVSALHHSGTNQVEHFFKDGSFFGWDTLKRLCERELSQSKKGEMVSIPMLRSSYIYRDSWIKLSVTPAKIMLVGTYAAKYCYTELMLSITQQKVIAEIAIYLGVHHIRHPYNKV